MTVAYVGLGANLGSREETLRRAVAILGEADGVDVLAVRDRYRRRAHELECAPQPVEGVGVETEPVCGVSERCGDFG